MKTIGVITDSNSSIGQEEAKRLGIQVVPMPFSIDGADYLEDVNLTRDEFFEKQKSGAKIQTSQPAPADVMAAWDEGLKEYEKILYLPMSSGLSSSCGAAAAMAQDEPYEGRVLVVDHGQVASPLHRLVLDALELIEKGYPAEEIKEMLEDAGKYLVIYIGVETLEYLKQGGRITPAAAALGAAFNIKPILKLETGKLDSYKKCHGFGKAKRTMIEAIKNDMETRFRDAYEAGAIHLLAAGSASKEETEHWLSEIREAFPGMEVFYDDLSLSVSCHIGPGGLGIGCAVKAEFIRNQR